MEKEVLKPGRKEASDELDKEPDVGNVPLRLQQRSRTTAVLSSAVQNEPLHNSAVDPPHVAP